MAAFAPQDQVKSPLGDKSKTKILVLAPMDSERQNFEKAVGDTPHCAEYFVHSSGIGKANAAATISLALGKGDIRYDMVAIVGYVAASPSFKQGDVVAPKLIRYHDTVSPEGLVPEFDRTYPLLGEDDAVCLSGDVFIDGEKSASLVEKFGDNVFFDMEGAATAQICARYGIPVLMVKFISDIPGRHNYESFTSFVANHTDFSPILQRIEEVAKSLKE